MDKYKKIKIIGKGSFGYAVLVESRKNKKQFIIKIIDLSKMDDKQIQEALTEVQVLKVVRYPYVVSYRQSFMEKMCLCIVMDYCQGGDMFNLIAKQKEIGTGLPESTILGWFVQMALALKHVHERKILHRDLKTQNIFLTSKGEVKIGDFGIARVLQHTYDCANTAIGTPYYLSPEICQQKPYNHKSDIWSLGCILYELTTLNHAFDANNMKGLIQKILKGNYPAIPKNYSDDLRRLIAELLITDPNKRPNLGKILEMPFLKNRVNELFSNTLKIHQSQLEKEGTSILELKNYGLPSRREEITKEAEKTEKYQKKAEKSEERNFKKQERPGIGIGGSGHRIEVVSKSPLAANNSSLSKKKEPSQNSSATFKPLSEIKQPFSIQRNAHQPLHHNHHHTRESKQKQCKQTITKVKQVSVQKRKQKSFDEQQTLEQQGYNVLLNQMKNFLSGNGNNSSSSSKHNQEKQAQFQKDNIVPKFLNVNGQKMHIPGMNQRDTVGSKIEALRVYLEKQIGKQFMPVYKMIQNDKDEDYIQAKQLLGKDKSKFIPLIIQLIVCEDQYY